MGDESGLGGSLLAAAQDVLEAVLQEVDAAALRQLKAASVAWCAYARRELCHRLWVRLSRREGQPEPAGVDSITDLDVECLNEAGRPWEVVVAGRQLPQLARLHGWGFVVDVQAVREAGPGAEQEDDHNDEEDEDAPLGGVTLRSCIQGEGDPPDELLLAAVACAAPGTVHGVPVQRLREDDAIGELGLQQSGIDDAAATLLGLMLPAAMSVRSLDIAYNGIGVEGASTLAVILKETQIQELNLRFNELGPQGGAALAEGLKGNTTLRSLDVCNNRLCGLDDCGHGTYTTEGITKLCEGLKGSAVTSLNLAHNGLGPKGGAALAEGLKGNSTLRMLNLGANQLCGVYYDENGDIQGTYTAEGITKLCEALKGSAVTSLDLAGNQLCGLDWRGNGTYTAEGITKLCEALKGSAVTSLDLRDNRLGPKGAAALAEGLKGNSTLQLLDIEYNYIRAEGASALAAILKETQITTLYLQENGLGPEGGAALAEGLKGNSRLQSLNLWGNGLNEEAKRALRDAAGSSVQIEF